MTHSEPPSGRGYPGQGRTYGSPSRPDAYQPDAYQPGAYQPDAYPPDGYQPDGYQPDQYRPNQYQPDQSRPDQYQPNQYQPIQYPPDQYQPDQSRPGHYQPASQQPGQYAPPQDLPGRHQPAQYQQGRYQQSQYQPDQYQPDRYAPNQYQPAQYRADQYRPGQPEPGPYQPDSYQPDPYQPDQRYRPDEPNPAFVPAQRYGTDRGTRTGAGSSAWPGTGPYPPASPGPARTPDPAAEPDRMNTWAVGALVCAILGNLCLSGLILGIVGLVRSAALGRGRGMSIAALVVSCAWMVFSVVYLIPKADATVRALDTTVSAPLPSASTDPGCAATESAMTKFLHSTNTDGSDLQRRVADLKTLVTRLDAAASRTPDRDTASAIRRMATDARDIADDFGRDVVPSTTLQHRFDADGKALSAICDG